HSPSAASYSTCCCRGLASDTHYAPTPRSPKPGTRVRRGLPGCRPGHEKATKRCREPFRQPPEFWGAQFTRDSRNSGEFRYDFKLLNYRPKASTARRCRDRRKGDEKRRKGVRNLCVAVIP